MPHPAGDPIGGECGGPVLSLRAALVPPKLMMAAMPAAAVLPVASLCSTYAGDVVRVGPQLLGGCRGW